MRTSLAARHSLLIGALVAEAGKLELESVCFDLPDMVEEVVDLLAGQARSKNLELACFVGDGVPSTIRADLGRLRQILVNLVGNAVKFTDRGEVMVWVTLTRSPSAATRQGEEEPPGSPTWLQLAVTDTGVGVPESQKDQIFESFTQADGTMARRFGGTGLGLAICTQLVDLMAGEIGFESEESRGSRFWIRIPVEVASQPDPETAPALSNFDGLRAHPLPEATVEAETTADAEGEVLAHVLVAEDNEVNQQVIIAFLESLDCRVDAVANGQEAVDQLERSSSYDLVFMDCQMPTMDGFAATRAIRAREAEAAQAEGGAPVRRLPIVALTAHALSSDREDCLAAGMDDYLTKPFTKADLAGAIDRAKQQDWAAGQAPAESERPDPPPSAHPVPGASVDPAPLRRLAATFKGDGSTKVVASVVNTFLASSQKLLSAIRDSVEADDPKALVSAAHTLKSSSAQVGAQGLSNLCKQLEALGRGGSCEGARELANRISEEFESVQEGLAAEDFGARDG